MNVPKHKPIILQSVLMDNDNNNYGKLLIMIASNNKSLIYILVTQNITDITNIHFHDGAVIKVFNVNNNKEYISDIWTDNDR